MSKKQVTIPVFIPHSGCPQKCVFCNQWKSSGCRETADAASVRRKIEEYLRHIPESVIRIEVAFFGANFTGIPDTQQRELLAAALLCKEQGLVQGIRLSTRPDYITEEGLELLQRYSVDTVELGVQSFYDDILTAAGRGHSVSDVYRAVRSLSERGIGFVLQLMTGLPGDTREASFASARFAAELKPEGVRIFPAVVLRDTGLEEMYRRGRYAPLSLEEAVDRCAEMYRIITDSGIPVIRTGLHPLENDTESVIAGPYHTAFGFLVKSRLKRGILEQSIYHARNSMTSAYSRIHIAIPSRNYGEYIGHKKENLRYLSRHFAPLTVEYTLSSAETGEPVITLL
jgi:histone acetyltransferase (RNA polymerase elongator complex component)